MVDSTQHTPSDLATARLALGQAAHARLTWAFERLTSTYRIWLLNNDESGSMEHQLHQNALAFDKVAALLGERADAIIIHGFGYDSLYQIFAAQPLVPLFRKVLTDGNLKGEVVPIGPSLQAAAYARRYLATRATHGATCPGSHPRFLQQLAAALDGLDGTIELVVANTSDGGFDQKTPQQEIQDQMKRITARCRCKLVANVLVGSKGSPSALHFFTGDPEAFDARLLLSTVMASPGVLLLGDVDRQGLALADAQGEERVTLQPSTPFWAYNREAEALRVYWPEGAARATTITVRRHQPQPGGREVIMTARVTLTPEDVRIDHDAREIFALISRCFSDNPYLRDESRESLNRMIAPLELLLGTRADLLRRFTATPEESELLGTFERRLRENLEGIQAARDAELSARERSARINVLNNVRRLLKDSLRVAQESLEQTVVERELAFLQGHPNHWAVWLQPALDELRAQLSLTQQEVGGAMEHLSTRIRTRKSRDDGQTRAVDRHVEALVARSRARHDAAARAHDPKDDVPIEQPGVWLSRRCPITRAPLTEGLAAIPFVADRSDLTSGNVASGGQNVDRIPVERDVMLSLAAVRSLMWGTSGQMASPYCTSRGVYNAAIPVLLGPATPSSIRELQRAIGWLCTGTSAFEPAMAEAIPAALGSVLGALPSDEAQRREGAGSPATTPDEQAHALLRTTALFKHLVSYPYVSGTAVFDESAPKKPLPDVWALALMDGADAACLQNTGCISSVLARAVTASVLDLPAVARGMFAWACRNIARGILGTEATDGRGGVEGIRRLAALLCHDIELAGYAPRAPTEEATPAPRITAASAGGSFDPGTIAKLLGPELASLWPATLTPGPDDFVEALNTWIGGLAPEQLLYALDRLPGVLTRFDARPRVAAPVSPVAPIPVAPPTKPVQAVQIERVTHAHFSLLSLEALRPVRRTTPTPGLADESLEMRRVLKFAETTWIPPRDARLPEGALAPSARRFLNEHSAMIPVRALLRLAAADCLGLPRLEALRASQEAPSFPRVDDVVSSLAALLGGTHEVLLTALRALAFVVVDANGYADKHWAETPLRTAPLVEAMRVLGLSAAPEEAPPPVYYGPRALIIPPASEPDWPKMVGKGYLPKSRRVGPDGEPLGPPLRFAREEIRELPDIALCQKGTAAIIAQVESEGHVVFPALHREARAVLGAYPRDLRGLPEPELRKILKEELVPALAGRTKGDPNHPRLFGDCAIILKAMVALGEDTTAFVAEEPEAFLHMEARTLRANAR